MSILPNRMAGAMRQAALMEQLRTCLYVDVLDALIIALLPTAGQKGIHHPSDVCLCFQGC